MAHVLTEGRFALSNAEDIIYPRIDSCLTMTLLGGHGRMAGAHVVAAINRGMGQLDLSALLALMGDAIAKPDRLHLFLVGDTHVWDNNVQLYNGMADLYDIGNALDLGMSKVTVHNVREHMTNGGGAVDVVARAAGYVDLYRSGTNLQGFLGLLFAGCSVQTAVG